LNIYFRRSAVPWNTLNLAPMPDANYNPLNSLPIACDLIRIFRYKRRLQPTDLPE